MSYRYDDDNEIRTASRTSDDLDEKYERYSVDDNELDLEEKRPTKPRSKLLHTLKKGYKRYTQYRYKPKGEEKKIKLAFEHVFDFLEFSRSMFKNEGFYEKICNSYYISPSELLKECDVLIANEDYVENIFFNDHRLTEGENSKNHSIFFLQVKTLLIPILETCVNKPGGKKYKSRKTNKRTKRTRKYKNRK
jgi:hypothetical protein